MVAPRVGLAYPPAVFFCACRVGDLLLYSRLTSAGKFTARAGSMPRAAGGLSR